MGLINIIKCFWAPTKLMNTLFQFSVWQYTGASSSMPEKAQKGSRIFQNFIDLVYNNPNVHKKNGCSCSVPTVVGTLDNLPSCDYL